MFVFSEVDGWVPNDYAELYMNLFDEATHRTIKPAHAFMMDKGGSEEMAKHVWEWIQDVLHHEEEEAASAAEEAKENVETKPKKLTKPRRQADPLANATAATPC